MRYNPYTGILLKKYTVPKACQITSCAFGGANLDQLFITSAAAGIAEARWTADGDQTNAGHLFKLDLSGEGIKGLPANSYKL